MLTVRDKSERISRLLFSYKCRRQNGTSDEKTPEERTKHFQEFYCLAQYRATRNHPQKTFVTCLGLIRAIAYLDGFCPQNGMFVRINLLFIKSAGLNISFQPMPLLKRRVPFNHPDFIFEVKWDGFRSLAFIEHGRTQLLSRNGHRFASFATLEKLISAGLPDTAAVIDGEICSLDKKGRPQFNDLLFRRGNYPCFLAFDLLMWNGKDYRRESLVDRKQELRRMLNGSTARIQYVDHVEGAGIPLFNQVCEWDLEGVVAKQKYAPYVADREQSTWFKIRNSGYSQWIGREELFERERNHEPVPGWHLCTLVSEAAFQSLHSGQK